jgi:hypothetical protein
MPTARVVSPRLCRLAAMGRRLVLGLLLALSLGAIGCATTNPYPPKRTYHTNNRVEEETCFDREGRKHGECRTWYDTGVLRSVTVYDHGKLVSMKMYAPDSQERRLP